MLSTQDVPNLQAKFELLSFKDGDDWYKHVSNFLSVVEELAAKNQTLSNTSKVSKIFCTLHEYFDSLPMDYLLKRNTIEEIINQSKLK